MTWYENMIGSFIEILSCVFILHLFSDAYLNEKFKTLLVILLAAIIDTLQYTFIGHYPVTFLIDAIFILSSLKLLTHREHVPLLFEFFMSFTGMILIECSLVAIANAVNILDTLTFSVRLVHLTILLLLTNVIGYLPRIQKVFRPFYERNQGALYLICANLFIIALMDVYLWNNKLQLYYQEVGIITIVIILWIFMNGILLKNLIDNRKKDSQLKLHTNYIDMIERLLDDLHAEKHEFRKHLQAIEGLTYNQPRQVELADDIQAYLNSLKNKEQGDPQVQSTSFLTGNRAINGLLYMKHKEAQEKSISLLYLPADSFPPFPCQEYELIELVGNLLNNAFEYVETLPEQERRVALKLDKNDDQTIIEVKNVFHSIQPLISRQLSQRGFSTKQGEKRGYGLYHVKLLAKKYNGRLSLFQEKEHFVAQVTFPAKQTEPSHPKSEI